MLNDRISFFISLLDKKITKSKQKQIVIRALHFASAKHSGQKRKDGTEFFIHPLETAINLLEINMDYETVSAGLLHDVLEDTPTTVKDIRRLFGNKIQNLVSSVTKIKNITTQYKNLEDKLKDERTYIKQIFNSFYNDWRAIIIKVCDRLHNIQTVQFLKPEKIVPYAQETLYIYSELAGIFMLKDIKERMQNICYKIIEPAGYDILKEQIENRKNVGLKDQKYFLSVISKSLRLMDLDFQILTRIKSVYSTSKKVKNGQEVEKIKDIIGSRILVKDIKQAYLALAAVHSNFKYEPSQFKDYISLPKSNLYQSLHTTIVYNGYPYEIQIRTFDMEQQSNFGSYSHDIYKNVYSKNYGQFFQGIVQKFNSFQDGIIKTWTKENDTSTIITKKSTNLILPIQPNSTVLDFYVSNYPKKFHRLEYVKDKNKIVPLYNLVDQYSDLEAHFSNQYFIDESWISFVNLPDSKMAIETKLLEIANQNSYNEVLEKITSIAKRQKEVFQKLKTITNKDKIDEIADKLIKSNVNIDMLRNLANIKFINKKDILETIEYFVNIKKRKNNIWILSDNSIYFSTIIDNECCNKIPGDYIVGEVIDDKVYCHLQDCIKIKSQRKLLSVTWNYELLNKLNKKFYVDLSIQYLNYEDFVMFIINFFSERKIHIKSLDFSNKNQKDYFLLLTIIINDRFQLDNILRELEKTPIIKKALRL